MENLWKPSGGSPIVPITFPEKRYRARKNHLDGKKKIVYIPNQN